MMKIILILLLSIKVAYLFELNSTYNSNTGLVYNGQKYNPKEYPYVVTIKIYSADRASRSICTGSLIRPLYVLTAAHCVYKSEPSLLEVYSGSSINNKDFRLVSKIDINNNYNPDNVAVVGDLSLVKVLGRPSRNSTLASNSIIRVNLLPLYILARPFRNVKKYITIGGNKEEFANLNPVKCVCIGFGAINDKDQLGLEGVMMTTDVRHGKTACRDYRCYLIRYTWTEYLCAITPMTSMVCKGDSGGPMICNGKLYGVCSFYYKYTDLSVTEDKSMVRCGGPTMQTVHVFVHFHLKWINSIIPPVKKKNKNNSGNMLEAHLTLHTIIALLMYRVLTSI